MRYGTLEVVCGPMFSGKSAEVLKRVLWERSLGRRRCLLIKPAFDTRFGASLVTTRAGTSAEALAVDAWPHIDEGVALVCIDEVQFMEPPHFSGDAPSEVRRLLARGVDVMACGLDIDSSGRPFAVTAALVAMADKVSKKAADCSVCGRPARKTFRKEPGGPSVQLGDGELYEARCNEHWSS
jgi:thymidine kinase